MIQNRPALLLSDPSFTALPSAAFRVDFSTFPDFGGLSLHQLGGIQPVTGAMMKAAGGLLADQPSAGEIELHRKLGTKFQMVSVVVNIAAMVEQPDGERVGVPYSISLIPSQKRGAVQEVGVDNVAVLDLDIQQKAEWTYLGYDPFQGDWSLYSQLGFILGNPPKNAKLDELGLVVDRYFLATAYDADDVLTPEAGIADLEANARYHSHRAKRLFRPFKRPVSRRVWGAESPIELFLFQELLRRGLQPELQQWLYPDGTVLPSLYHSWRDRDPTPGEAITEADLFFPKERVAVFCDGGRFHSTEVAQKKDQRIVAALEAIGVRAVRVSGKAIVKRLGEGADKVCAAL